MIKTNERLLGKTSKLSEFIGKLPQPENWRNTFHYYALHPCEFAWCFD